MSAPRALSHADLVALVAADEPRKPSICKFCKKGGLQWVRDNEAGKWMLVEVAGEELTLHRCEEAKAHFKSL